MTDNIEEQIQNKKNEIKMYSDEEDEMHIKNGSAGDPKYRTPNGRLVGIMEVKK